MAVKTCIDAGSEFCPCHLADLGACIVCSRLRNKERCQCEWSGTCIYMEYLWAGSGPKAGRVTRRVPVISRCFIRENLLLISLGVGGKLARDLVRPGSFLFLRADVDSHFFDLPVAVIHSCGESGRVVVAVEVRGPKTRRLERNREWMRVRGPYWNGILGVRHILDTRNSNCLLVLGGVTQASGVQVANHLAQRGNKVHTLFNSSDIVFVEPYLDPSVSVSRAAVLSAEWLDRIRRPMEEGRVSLVYSGGNDRQHKLIAGMIGKSGHAIRLATANNNRIYCGEGICGGCLAGDGGELFRCCKAQPFAGRCPASDGVA